MRVNSYELLKSVSVNLSPSEEEKILTWNMHKKLELFGKSTHTTMLNPNLSSENCGKKIQSDRPKKWSKITILSPITFWENSRSWSWSDLRSLFEQVILMWSKIAKKVIGHYFGSRIQQSVKVKSKKGFRLSSLHLFLTERGSMAV